MGEQRKIKIRVVSFIKAIEALWSICIHNFKTYIFIIIYDVIVCIKINFVNIKNIIKNHYNKITNTIVIFI